MSTHPHAATASAMSNVQVARLAATRANGRMMTLTPPGPHPTTNPQQPTTVQRFLPNDRIQLRCTVRENPSDENSAILACVDEIGTITSNGASNRYPGMHTYGIVLENRGGGVFPIPEVALKQA